MMVVIVGDAFARPMVRALEEAEAAGKPYDISSLMVDRLRRRDVDRRRTSRRSSTAACRC